MINQRLCEFGDEERALKLAEEKYEQCIREGKRLPSEMFPATMVHELVGEIKRKVATLTTAQILSDLDKAHKQIEEGKGVSADAAMEEIGRQHGF